MKTSFRSLGVALFSVFWIVLSGCNISSHQLTTDLSSPQYHQNSLINNQADAGKEHASTSDEKTTAQIDPTQATIGHPQPQNQDQLPSDNLNLPAIQAPQGTFYLPILMYHQIKDLPKQNPYIVAPAMFDQQLSWLEKNGFHTISYEDFYEAMAQHTALPDKSVVITFDDGFRNQYENAIPLLKKHNMTGIFFIYTNAIDLHLKSAMTWDMIEDLAKNGMEIGSHTVSHPDLAHLKPAQVKTELTQSKAELEKKLGITIKFFAYPGGAYLPWIVQEVKKTGYLSAVSTIHSVFHPNDENLYLVRRIHIDNDMESFVSYVSGAYEKKAPRPLTVQTAPKNHSTKS